jgi:hypothetical protein
MRRSPWTLILIILLTACRQAPTAPPVSSPPAVREVVTPPTALPITTLVEATVQNSPPTAQASQPPPERVWLPYGDSGYPTLTVRGGKISDEPSPVSITVFWDYTSVTGRLAYGNEAFHTNAITNRESVTDLWVYDYNTGKKELWLEDNVIGALWSPVIDPKTGLQPLAVALPNNTLALMTGPGQLVTLSETFSPFFSWSPDGRWLAFSEAEALFVTSVETGEIRQLTPREEPWYSSKPVWAPGTQALIYTYKSFVKVVKLDGSAAFIPIPAGGDPQPEQPVVVVSLLWSEQGSRLITESAGMGVMAEVTVYELSDDLRTILGSYTLEDVGLGGWMVPGESLILDGGPLWSLAKAAPLEAGSGTLFSQFSLDGQWRADVLAYNGCFGGWGKNKSYQHLSFVHLNSGVEQIVDRQFRSCEAGIEPHFKDLFWSSNSRYLYYARTAEVAESGCRSQRQLLHRLALPPDGSPAGSNWDITRLGGGSLSPDGAKLATWQLRPAMGEDFTGPDYDLLIWDINSGELERPGPPLVYPGPAPMAWSPNSQTLIYLQFDAGCPPDGKTHLIQLDFPDLAQKLLLTAKNPSFSDIIWDQADELRLFNGTLEWRYNFDTQELKPWY